MDDNINNETMFSVDESEKIKETGGNTEHNIKEELEKTSNKESEKKKPNLSYIQVPSDKDKSTFVHTADLHLAPRSSTIAKRDSETGRLLRDLDMDKAFIQAVNETIESQSKPSAFIIAGDIYDTWKGSADAFITSVLQIKRLVKSGIAVIGIAGNHDTPPNTIKTPMFQMLADVFSDNEMVCLAYNEIKHVVVGDVEYVLLPHYVCIRGDFDRSDLAAQSNAKYRVLLVHGVAAGDPSKRFQLQNGFLTWIGLM